MMRGFLIAILIACGLAFSLALRGILPHDMVGEVVAGIIGGVGTFCLLRGVL